MKKLCFVLFSALLLTAVPAAAQWQTPNHSVPIGKGGGNTGFSSAAPGTAGRPLVSNGASSDPAFGTIGNSGFTAGAANTVKGSLNGTTTTDIAVPNCTSASQALQWTAGVGPSCGTLLTLTGYDMPINMGLSSSVVGGALTINLTTAAGAVPSGSSPVLIPFRSTTLTSGTVTWATVSAATSVVVPSGATLGTSNGVPFRIWVFADYNSGTPALSVAVCSNTATIFPCAGWENTLKTTTTISAGATSAGVPYATAGVVLDAIRIVGYCEYASGLATAGTYASACTTLQVFGPGVKKPGDIVQIVAGVFPTLTVATNATGSFASTNITANITPTSSANLVNYAANFTSNNSVAGSGCAHQMFRGSTGLGSQTAFTNGTGMAGSSSPWPQSVQGTDAPQSTTTQTYVVKFVTISGNTCSTPSQSSFGAYEVLTEIMG